MQNVRRATGRNSGSIGRVDSVKELPGKSHEQRSLVGYSP